MSKLTSMFSLPYLQVLRLTGNDALAFAHTQLSADVEGAEKHRWHAAAWCDAKGRCLAVLLFNVHGGGHVDLLLPVDQARDIAGKLKLYMLRRDVSLDIHPHVGAGAGAPLNFDPGRRIEVLDAPAETDEQRAAEWRLADLEAGIPWLGPETSGRHLPQNLGLEALDGVDYEKGCYPGQEIIARVHFRGRPPRRLSRIQIQTDAPPAPGTPVEDANGVNVGEMLWSIAADQAYGLAVVGREADKTVSCKVLGYSAELVTRFARPPFLKKGGRA